MADLDFGSVADCKELDCGSVADKELDCGSVADKELDCGSVAAKKLDCGSVADKELDCGSVRDIELDCSSVADKELDSGIIWQALQRQHPSRTVLMETSSITTSSPFPFQKQKEPRQHEKTSKHL